MSRSLPVKGHSRTLAHEVVLALPRPGRARPPDPPTALWPVDRGKNALASTLGACAAVPEDNRVAGAVETGLRCLTRGFTGDDELRGASVAGTTGDRYDAGLFAFPFWVVTVPGDQEVARQGRRERRWFRRFVANEDGGPREVGACGRQRRDVQSVAVEVEVGLPEVLKDGYHGVSPVSNGERLFTRRR